jgi:hypothetical protein
MGKEAHRQDPKILILVLSSLEEPWISILNEGQRNTWMKTSSPAIRIIPYFGTIGVIWTLLRPIRFLAAFLNFHGVSRQINSTIGKLFLNFPVRYDKEGLKLPIPEGLIATSAKTKMALNFALQYDFDYLVRTNTSTYLHLALLSNYLRKSRRQELYAGPLGWHNETPYVSGTCIVLSRDLVIRIVKDSLWDFGSVDDVAIGERMYKYGIEARNIPRLDELDLPSSDDFEISENYMIYRCKISKNSRRADAELMKLIHEKLNRFDA